MCGFKHTVFRGSEDGNNDSEILKNLCFLPPNLQCMYSLKHLNGEIRKSVVCSLLEKKTLFYTISAVRQACMNCTEVNVCKPSKKYNTHTHINTHSLTRTHARAHTHTNSRHDDDKLTHTIVVPIYLK